MGDLIQSLCKFAFPSTVKHIMEENANNARSYAYCDEEDDKDDVWLVEHKHGKNIVAFLDDDDKRIRELAWSKVKRKDCGTYVKYRANEHHGCRPFVRAICATRVVHPRSIVEAQTIKLMKEAGWDNQSIAKYLMTIVDTYYIETSQDRSNQLTNVGGGFFGWLTGTPCIRVRHPCPNCS